MGYTLLGPRRLGGVTVPIWLPCSTTGSQSKITSHKNLGHKPPAVGVGVLGLEKQKWRKNHWDGGKSLGTLLNSRCNCHSRLPMQKYNSMLFILPKWGENTLSHYSRSASITPTPKPHTYHIKVKSSILWVLSVKIINRILVKHQYISRGLNTMTKWYIPEM